MADKIPETMKAWAFSRRGKAQNVLELKSLPVPAELKPNEVLIKVSHVGLNPFGYIMVWVVPAMLRHKPAVPEFDFSGRIVKLGRDAGASLKIDEDVLGVLKPGDGVKLGRGSLAEYLVADKDLVLRKPEDMSLETAGGVGITFLTAAALLQKANLSPGDHVFVNGGSGGTGMALIPWVKEIVGEHGKVVTTCSPQTLELVKSFGADETIDYRAVDLPDHLAKHYSARPFDVVIDTVGQSRQLFHRSPKFLAAGKPFLCVGTPMADTLTLGNVMRAAWNMVSNTMWPRFLGGTPRQWMFVDAEQGAEESIRRVKERLAEGKVHVQIDSTFKMEDALAAYDKLMSRRARGKIVVKVQDL